MAHPEESHRVKIGVRLAGPPGDLGEWLADGAAFDAAGADALWLADPPESPLDPLALVAALAAVTFRSLLVTGLDRTLATVDRTLATIDELSRGRLRILAGGDADAGLAGSLCRVIRPSPGISAALTASDEEGAWVVAPVPSSRASWRTTLAEAAERRVPGLVMPANPRLLDILRNPDDLGDRRDLQLSVG